MKKSVLLSSIVLPFALAAVLLGGSEQTPDLTSSSTAQVAVSEPAPQPLRSLAAGGERHEVVASEGPASDADPDAALLRALADSIHARNGAAAAETINAFLGRGPAAIDELMRRLELSLYDEETSQALGTLLQSAAVLAHNSPELFAPWTLDAIAETAVSLIGSGVGAARVLEIGLKGMGADLQPELLFELVAYHDEGGRSIGDFQHQIAVLSLMEGWARDMPADLEDQLRGMLIDVERDLEARNRAAQLLLARDWRRFAPELAQSLAEAEQSGHFDEYHLEQLRFHMGTQLAILPHTERYEYLQLVLDDAATASKAISQLEPYEAQQLLAMGTPDDLGERPYLELLVRSGSPEALEAGLELLPHYQGDGYAQRHLLAQLLHLDGGYHPGVLAELERRFTERQSQADPLWGTFNINTAHLSDQQLADTVLPFLERTRGEQSASRTRFLAKVEQRFPELAGVY